MTLKEKFYKKFISKPDLYPLEDCEIIADEFAIGFAKWILSECDSDVFIKNEVDELLEMYKKQLSL